MADLPPGYGGWVLAGVGAVITALSSAVSFLYRRESIVKDRELADEKARSAALEAILSQKEKEWKEESQQKRLEWKEEVDHLRAAVADCQRDREEIRVELAKVSVRVQMLESKYEVEKIHMKDHDKRLDNLEG